MRGRWGLGLHAHNYDRPVEKLGKIILVVFFLRALTAVVKPFLPFDLPHVWRQVDTLGVSIRYWLRWTQEPDLMHPLVPAVLNSMDGYAIMPMEFPLVNLLGAPFFAFGPAIGKNLASLTLVILNFALTWLCYRNWRSKRILGFEAGPAFLLLPVVGISSTFVTKFMPDYLAMVLALLGSGLLWECVSPNARADASRASRVALLVGALALIALGLLVKPTAVTVLVLLLLLDGLLKHKMQAALWSLIPLAAAGFYYTLGLQWIASLQDTAGLFAVAPRQPLTSLVEFLTEPKALFKLVFEDVLFIAGPVLVALGAALLSGLYRKAVLILAGAIAVQLIAIGALDGSHSFVHSYYHIGTAPVVVLVLLFLVQGLLFEDVAQQWPKRRRALLVLFGLGALSLIYQNLFFELRSLSARRASKFVWPSEIEDLKSRNPNFPWGRGYTFRASRALAYPNLGIHFGEREGSSTAEFGFYLTQEVPLECNVVDQTGSVSLV